MNDRALTTGQILELLEAAPLRLAQAAVGLPPQKLEEIPAPGDWSARDVLAHLRSCADMWGGAVARILNEDRPSFKAVNPRTWIKQTDYLELAFHPSLEAYTAQRAGLLDLLRPLPPAGWEREALVSVAGKPLLRTVYFYAHWLATHERPHLKQIERALAGNPHDNM